MRIPTRNPILPASLEAVLAYVLLFKVLFEEAENMVFDDDTSAENTRLLPDPTFVEYGFPQDRVPLMACEEERKEEYRA